MASHSTTLRQISGLPEPAQLASELRHLPGLVFFDSSSSESGTSIDNHARFSLITARPEKVFKGNLFHAKDRALLEEIYRENQSASATTPDLGFPSEGLYGYVTYEGEFTFGLYRECLIYDHLTQMAR